MSKWTVRSSRYFVCVCEIFSSLFYALSTCAFPACCETINGLAGNMDGHFYDPKLRQPLMKANVIFQPCLDIYKINSLFYSKPGLYTCAWINHQTPESCTLLKMLDIRIVSIANRGFKPRSEFSQWQLYLMAVKSLFKQLLTVVVPD